MSAALADGVSVVVPVYNGEESLEPLSDRIDRVLSELGTPYEIVFVDDRSPDGSWETIVAIGARNPRVRALRLMRNSGQHNALLAGVRAARYRTTVTIDDDLQHPPEEIPKLLAALEAGADLVYGTPETPSHASWRNITSRLAKLALSMATSSRVASSVSAFRAFRTQLREAFAGFASPHVSLDVLLSWGTEDVAAVAVRHDPRDHGTSGYTVRKLLRHTLNMLTGYSTWPLRLASIIGFAFTLFGIVILAWVLIVYAVKGQQVPGFAFLASITAVFSGAQLFALGIIGEYLARVHFRTLNRPPYTVAAELDAGSGDDA